MKENNEKKIVKEHKKRNFFFKEAGVFASCLLLASGATYGVIYANRGETTTIEAGNKEEIPATPAEKLLASMMDLKVFSIDADLQFTDNSDGNSGSLSVTGYADLSNYDDIKISGDMAFSYGLSKISGKLGYFDNTVYVDYNTSYLKMETKDFQGVLDVLNGANINVSLPEELTSLDLNKIASDLEAMEPEKTNSGYMFALPISDLVTVYFLSDDSSEYNFTGIKTNKFYYGSVYTYLEADIEEITDNSVTLVNPEKVENAPKYNSFKPAFNLVPAVANFIQERSNTVNLALALNKDDGSEKKPFISLDMDLSYNLDDNQYALSMMIDETSYRTMTSFGEIVGTLPEDDPSLKGEIKEETAKRHHEFNAYVYEDVLYLDHADNKISFATNSINMAVAYILSLIDEDGLDGVLEDLMNGMKGVDIKGMLSNLSNLNGWITDISVISGENGEADKTAITFNLSIFGLDTPSFTLYANSDETEFLGIGIEEFTYKGYSASFYLGKETYSMKEPVTDEYTEMDVAIGLVPVVGNLIDDTQFRVDLSGKVESASQKPISIAGGFQFDIADDYGYGDITITDRDEYKHKIVADYSAIKTLVTNEDNSTSEKITDGNLLLSYNDTMKAKMSNAEMTDLLSAVGDIAGTRDEHFYELFGDLLKNLTSTPVYYAIANMEIGILFDCDLLSNFSATEGEESGTIEFDVGGALLGLDCTIHIAIDFDNDGFNYIRAEDIVFGETTISFEMNIAPYNESLDSSRLSYNDFINAMEIADLTTLLKFGINTSQYDGYRFSSEKAASVTFSIFGIDAINLEIPLDIKVDNYKGDVSIAVEMTSVPIFDTLILDLNGTSDADEIESRSASIYYYGGKVYMRRVDKVYDSEQITPKWWKPSTWYYEYTHYDVTYECVADTENFMDNIMHYLVELILGVKNKTVLDAINGSSSSSGSDYQIPYESIVKNFDYSEENSYFNIDIDLAALTNNEDLDSFTVLAGVDQSKEELSYVDVKLNVGLVGVSIGVSAYLPLVETYPDSYQEEGNHLDMAAMTSCMAEMADDTVNVETKTKTHTYTNTSKD